MTSGTADINGGPLTKGNRGPRRERTFAEPDDARRIVAWWHQGLSAPQIAARLGVSPGTVWSRLALLRIMGYDLPKRNPQDTRRGRR